MLGYPSPSGSCLLQGEVFAAEGYAKVTGDVGVCIATSGPGATNLVTGLADALLDSVPMVAITGQVKPPPPPLCWQLDYVSREFPDTYLPMLLQFP